MCVCVCVGVTAIHTDWKFTPSPYINFAISSWRRQQQCLSCQSPMTLRPQSAWLFSIYTHTYWCINIRICVYSYMAQGIWLGIFGLISRSVPVCASVFQVIENEWRVKNVNYEYSYSHSHSHTYMVHCHSATWVCSKKGFRWRLLPSDFCFLPAWLVNGSLFYVKQKKATHW